MVTATANAEVLLCAGAIGSPQLLQLSGLGPASLLQSEGISVVKDLPGVGANLQDHLQIRTVYKVKNAPTLNTQANSLVGKARIGLEYAFKRTGPMSMAPSQLGAFTRSDASQPYPNLEYHVQPLSLDAFGQPLHNFNAFTASVCNLNPTSHFDLKHRIPPVNSQLSMLTLPVTSASICPPSTRTSGMLFIRIKCFSRRCSGS